MGCRLPTTNSGNEPQINYTMKNKQIQRRGSATKKKSPRGNGIKSVLEGVENAFPVSKKKKKRIVSAKIMTTGG